MRTSLALRRCVAPLFLRTTSSMSTLSLHQVFETLHANPQDVLLLDGGTGEELFRRNVPDDRKIWSATALVNEQYHEILEQVHTAFLQSGSRIITTNSYGVVPGVGFTEEEISKYMTLSGQIARRAVDKFGAGFVLGSLGPLVESYRADMIMPHDKGVQCYTRACQALAPYVNAYIGETLSCVEESLQIADAIEGLDDDSLRRPLLISYTLDANGNLRDGQDVKEGIRQLLTEVAKRGNVEVLAILFNCSEPEALSIALERIHADEDLVRLLKESKILLGAYANRLTAVDPNWTLADSEAPQPLRDDLSEQRYREEFVSSWTSQLGVQLVGGCCGITPEHISYLRNELDKRKQ